MTDDGIDWKALAILIEENWDDFVYLCGEEWIAEKTEKAIKNMAGVY